MIRIKQYRRFLSFLTVCLLCAGLSKLCASLPACPAFTANAEAGAFPTAPAALGESDFVTPEMFGAAGDGVTDDTAALQSAFSCGSPVLLPPKEYRTTSTLVITGKASIFDAGSSIRYSGKESAVRFTGVNNQCNVALGSIFAENGNGIEFYCDSRKTRCQYIDLSFDIIEAGHCCILFHRALAGDPMETGWLNEIRIHDGRFQAGQYGVYADAKGQNAINNIKLTNIGFEGVKVGACLADYCTAWSFINPRIIEMTIKKQCVFQTRGVVTGLIIVLGDRFEPEKSSFSSQTQGVILAPIQGTDLGQNSCTVGNIGEIIDGSVFVYDRSMLSLMHFQELPRNTDLNTVKAPGNYCYPRGYGSAELINCPTDAAFTMSVSCADGSPGHIVQELREYDSATVYRRTYFSEIDDFTDWSRNATEEDIAALRQEIDTLRNIIAALQ